MMNVLIITPATPGLPKLDWISELGELGAIDEVKLTLVGGRRATRMEVGEALRRENPRNDIVIWSGHGEPNRLCLSDGLSVDGKWLAAQLRRGRPEIIILAACLSGGADDRLGSLAFPICRAGIHSVVMSTSITDIAAALYGVEFVRAMVASADVGEAHAVAVSAVAQHSVDEARRMFLVPALTNGLRGLTSRLDRQDERISGLEISVNTVLVTVQETSEQVGRLYGLLK